MNHTHCDTTARVSLKVDPELVNLAPEQVIDFMDKNKDRDVFINVDFKQFKKYVIITTHAEITRMLSELKSSRMFAKHMLSSSLTCILEWDPKVLNQHRRDGSKKYTDFCNDIVIYYCARLVVFNIPISVSPQLIDFYKRRCSICGAKSDLKCSKCKKAYYCCDDHQKEDWRNHKLKCENTN